MERNQNMDDECRNPNCRMNDEIRMQNDQAKKGTQAMPSTRM